LLAFGGFDLVGALQSAIDAGDELGGGVRRIERLVRINVARGVAVGSNLPAGAVDRFEAGLHHFHGLIAGDGAERGDVRVGVHQIPETLGAETRKGVLDLDGAAQAENVGAGIRTGDSGPAWIGGPVSVAGVIVFAVRSVAVAVFVGVVSVG